MHRRELNNCRKDGVWLVRCGQLAEHRDSVPALGCVRWSLCTSPSFLFLLLSDVTKHTVCDTVSRVMFWL